MYECMDVCMYDICCILYLKSIVCIFVSFIYMYLCMYVVLYVCLSVCMYVCMYLFKYMYVYVCMYMYYVDMRFSQMCGFVLLTV